MSTQCSIAAFGAASASGAIQSRRERILDIFKTKQQPLATLEVKDIMFNSNAPTKERTDIDATMSQLHLDCELDIVDTKVINGNEQSVYALPSVTYKESNAVMRRLTHKKKLLANTQTIIDELEVEHRDLVAKGL